MRSLQLNNGEAKHSIVISCFLIKTRENAIDDVSDYQIPVTQLGDYQIPVTQQRLSDTPYSANIRYPLLS